MTVWNENWTVYLITNTTNDKGYVGITSRSLEERWGDHIISAYSGRTTTHGRSYAFHAAIQKYGEENFEIEELETDLTLEDAQSQEEYWIERSDTYAGNRNGYNLTYGGEEPDL